MVPESPPGAAELRLELAVDLAVPSIVRTRLRRWLDELGWPPDDADDVVLAVHEATANVVDHAYRPGDPGTVRLTARAAAPDAGGGIEVRVRDRGRWRPAAADPGHRGHGLTVMRGCMDTVDVTTGDGGTEVRMVLGRTAPGRSARAHARAVEPSSGIIAMPRVSTST